MPRSTNKVKTHAVYIALCAHEPARCCRNSGRIRRKMSEGRWRTDASAAQPCDLSKLPPAGHPRTPKNMMKVVRPGQRMRRQRAIGCGLGGRPQPLSDTWMPEPLHECPRSPPNPSPSRYLGARNDEQKSLCASFRQVQWRTTKCIAQGARTRGPAEARGGRAWGVPPSQMSRSLLRCSILLNRGPVLA